MKKHTFDSLKKIVKRPPSLEDRQIKQYSLFLDQVKTQLGDPTKQVGFELKLEREVPGLIELFESFSTGSQQFVHQDWNPFSQKLYMSPEPGRAAVLTKNFSAIVDNCGKFVELAHEAMHILLWEPFFTGKYRPKSQDEFVDFALGFEGFCFWFGDILITPLLRAYLPDGEFVFSRSHISQKFFHPYRVFDALKMNDPKKIMEIYVDGFRGYETELFNKREKDLFVHELSTRVYKFYVNSARPVKGVYRQFQEVGLFSEYYSRFCSIPNLPALLSSKGLNLLKAGDPNEYCRQIVNNELDHLNKVSKREILRVRARRHLQTRAYSSICLDYALKNDLCYSRTGRKFPKNKIIRSNRQYLDKIEALLHELAQGSDFDEIMAKSTSIDQFFSRSVRSELKKNQLWMAERRIFYPVASLKSATIGVLKKSKADPAELKSRVYYLVNNYYPSAFKNPHRVTAKSSKSRSDVKARVDLYKQVIDGKLKDNAQLDRVRKQYNRAVVSSGILEQWSLSLDKLDPLKNQFGEFLFIYE